jgi:hypothetical protein
MPADTHGRIEYAPSIIAPYFVHNKKPSSYLEDEGLNIRLIVVPPPFAL